MIFLEFFGYFFIFNFSSSSSSSNKLNINSNSISMKRFDLTAANNSADENPSSISTKTNRSRSNSSIRTRVAVRRSISNLGTINSHIVVRPVPSKTIDVQQKTNFVDQREKLADEQCRRSHEAMMWMSRVMCCSHCHPCAAQSIPPVVPNEQQSQLSAKESATIVQRSLTSIKSRLNKKISEEENRSKTETSDRDVQTTVNDFNRNVAENDQSMFSFPDHDDHFSQRSDRTTKDDPQLNNDTQVFVDDLIRTAEEKYQRILRMSVNDDPTEQNSLSEKSTTKPKQKLVTISEHPITSNENGFCAELCQKLNLSNSDQVNDIIRILASNAPHILKENSSKPTVHPEKFASINPKISESNLCQQLLLHPPFKPKRLIYLCPDGGIQVLSAVDENLQETQSNNEQNYRLNYSNSAVKSQRSSTDERSVALEFETTTTLTTINVKPMSNKSQMFTEHEIQPDQSSLDDPSITNDPLHIENSNQMPMNQNQHAETKSKTHPIVNIDLDLLTDDDDDILPTLVFKRIITLDSSSTNTCHYV